ncbi:MAG: prepilin-type N-terminal cleavage/methylation domain-containing protein [Terriglobales bacterium]
MRRHKGFSLIELLIVVAIILIIAAIAIPNLLRSRMSANEASAISSLRQINTAQTTYSINYPTIGYADALTKLAEPPVGTPVSPSNAGLVDWVLGCASQPCRRSGYDFTIIAAPGTPIINNYSATAVPAVPGQTGVRGFCSDQITVIRFDPAGGTACTAALQ